MPENSINFILKHNNQLIVKDNNGYCDCSHKQRNYYVIIAMNCIEYKKYLLNCLLYLYIVCYPISVS